MIGNACVHSTFYRYAGVLRVYLGMYVREQESFWGINLLGIQMRIQLYYHIIVFVLCGRTVSNYIEYIL